MSHPYSEFIHQVQKPARYVGGEFNETRKNLSETDLRLCLAFPDVYDIGMSHMGTKILYKLVNQMPRASAERTFAPWLDMEDQLRTHDVPLVSLENATPLCDFDVVGFSLQYELTFTNVLNMLDLGRIAVRSADRPDGAPLIIAGGPVATHPEPIAAFIDVFLIGDAEEKLPELLNRWTSLKDNTDLSRTEKIRELVKIGALYAPALYERTEDPRSGLEVVVPPSPEAAPYPIQRAVLEDLDRYPFPDDSPEPVAEAIFDRMSIEIARGCTEGCRFCQAGMIYRPVRERDPDAIVDTLVSAIEKGGYDEASLTSLSTADYSCISPLIKKVMSRLQEKQVSLSVSSLRAYGLGDETLDQLKTGRAAGLTFAPEAGTQRMRDVINKNVSEEDIIESAHRVFSKGWNKMKLYFMIGLPTEEEEDVLGIVETGARVRNVGYNYHRKDKVTANVSVSSHVPKPHTPFQWCAMDTIGSLNEKQRILSDAAKRHRLRVKWHDVKTSYIEGIIARGDYAVSEAVFLAWENGARFDGWDECLNFDLWVDAFEKAGIETHKYLGTLPLDGGLPWDHISIQLEEGFLKREYRRAMRNKLSPPCGKPVWAKVHHTNVKEAEAETKKLVCYNCGVECDMTAMKDDRIVVLKQLKAFEPNAPEPTIPDLIQLGKKNRALNNPPPKRREQGVGYIMRLTYTKLGNVRLTSHLDLVRKLPRIFRRSGIGLKTSAGYSPKPLMSFSSALPLGMWSVEEALDIVMLAPMEGEILLSKLNQSTPVGLKFLTAVPVEKTSKGVAKCILASEYHVATPEGTDIEDLQTRIQTKMGAEHWRVARKSRKSGRMMEIDLKECVETLSIVSDELLRSVVPEYGDRKAPVVRAVLKERSGTFMRADLVIAYLLDTEPFNSPLALRSGLVWAPIEPEENAIAGEETVVGEEAVAGERRVSPSF